MSIRKKLKKLIMIENICIYLLVLDLLLIFIIIIIILDDTMLDLIFFIFLAVFLIIYIFIYNSRINNLTNAIKYLDKEELLNKKVQAIIYGNGGDTVLFYKKRMIIIDDKKVIDIDYKSIILYFVNFELMSKYHSYKINLILNESRKITIHTDISFFQLFRPIVIITAEKLIKAGNLNVLVGKTKENKKILKERYGIKL